MMEKTVRVLHVFGRTGRGGAESRIMDLYRRIDRDRIQFDFLVHADPRRTGGREWDSDSLMAAREEDDFDGEIRSLGGRIFALPRMGLHPGLADPFTYKKACGRFFETHRDIWDIVQGHMTSTAAIYFAAAKRSGVPLTVAHARSAGTDPGLKGILTKTLRRPLRDVGHMTRSADGRKVPLTDLCFACSHEAAVAVFGERDAVILPNAIDVGRFRYSDEVRIRLRRELDIEDCFVVGHVGSFRYAKNHLFLLRVFRRFLDLQGNPNDRLLLIGTGDLMPAVREEAEKLSIADRVIFAGDQREVEGYYQAMDVFAFPSRYEGLPGSVVEAQAAALPCLISDRITRDVDVTEQINRLGIGKDNDRGSEEKAEDLWAGRLSELRAESGQRAREEIADRVVRELIDAGFDADGQAEKMERFYLTGVMT